MSALPQQAPASALFPNSVIYKTANFRVAQDWEVPIPAFYIISSVKRCRSIIDFTNEEILELMDVQRLVRQGMKDLLGISDVYFFQNEDSAHGFHIWMFPRHDWMDKKDFGRKIESVRTIMEYAVKHMQNEEVFDQIDRCNGQMKNFLNGEGQAACLPE
jgi:hypothetical protein